MGEVLALFNWGKNIHLSLICIDSVKNSMILGVNELPELYLCHWWSSVVPQPLFICKQPFQHYSIKYLSSLMRHCLWMTINSEITSKAQMGFNILTHAFSCLSSVTFRLARVPPGASSTQLCFTVLAPPHEAQRSIADKQEIEEQMHLLVQSRAGKSA